MKDFKIVPANYTQVLLDLPKETMEYSDTQKQ